MQIKAKLSKKFDFEGKTYEIYEITTTDRMVIQTYSRGKPAEGWPYSILHSTREDIKTATGRDVLPELIQDAESVIRTKAWDRYCEAVRTVQIAENQ